MKYICHFHTIADFDENGIVWLEGTFSRVASGKIYGKFTGRVQQRECI